MNRTIEQQPEATLEQRIQAILDTQPEVEKALQCYARDLGVSLDHVVMGALVMVAQEYNDTTGKGMIPSLNV
jgi:hypothetical protein